MFKSWQIFVFSLVPLALVFAGVIIGAHRGIDASREVYPTAAPSQATVAAPTPSAPGATVIQIAAKNVTFDKKALSATAGQPVTVQFSNDDTGVPHNFAVYTDKGASQKIFSGELTTGPETINYTFTAPSTPGNYYFRCDVHPDQMNGSFTVK
ncbi:MAG TPA: cupredoxin domain-containing protein [Dehalococcoidia bacterium]|nr:cupredoxin domain-containing protein [Dehalococcoidia bacterium]